MSEPLERIAETEVARPALRGRTARWTALALLVFLLLGLWNFRDLWQAGPASNALASGSAVEGALERNDAYRSGETASALASGPGATALASGPGAGSESFKRADVVFEAWLVARNARTLVQRPSELFDTEHCAPAEKTLTLGIPMITMGLLAIPVALVTPNPALAYNFATLLLWLFSAMAMYLLVRDWTGSAVAGIVAGIFFAFGPWRVVLTAEHPSVYDCAWTVFALYFAQRLFAQGRWRDAVGLALACALQTAASIYPLVAAAFFSPPFLLWLLARDRLRNVRLAQVVFVLVFVAASGVLVLGPYLDARDAGKIGDRATFFFLKWTAFGPDGMLFLGWSALALAAVGLCVPRRLATPAIEGDPRWVLILGTLLVTVIAAGPANNLLLEGIWDQPPIRIPDFYAFISGLVPGFDSIRVVFRLGVVMVVTLCILSGIGTAWLIRIVPLPAAALAPVLIGIATLTVLLGSRSHAVVKVAVDPTEVEFFESLEQMGNDGPVLELPVPTGLYSIQASPQQILLSAYHRRRISTCYASYAGSDRARIEALADQLPDAPAVRALHTLGFTTVVLREPGEYWSSRFQRRLELRPNGGVSLLLERDGLAAYALQP